CILCARCIRFQDEIAYQSVLGFMNRGRGMEVVSFSEPAFNSKFSGNTIDICPVGALTSSDFRFQARVWEVSNVPNICPHCPVGCNLTLGTRLGKIRRIIPRENEAVNEIWLCDKGRFAHHYLVSEKRLTTPLIRRNGKLQEASWDEAIKTVARKLGEIKTKKGGSALAGIGSVRTTNEENYLFQKFMRLALESNNIDHRLETIDDLGEVEAWSLPTGSIRDVERAGAILVIGCDPSEEVPILELRIKKGVRRGVTLLVASPYKIELASMAKEWLKHRPGSEVALLTGLLNIMLSEKLLGEGVENYSGFGELDKSLQAYPSEEVTRLTGISEEILRGVAQTLAKSSSLVVIYGERVPHRRAVVTVLANLSLLKPDTYLLPVARGANAQGAKDMGVLPHQLGQERIDSHEVKERLSGLWSASLPSEPGLNTGGILKAATAGHISGLYVMGADLLANYPERKLAEEALDKLEFLVVQDLFLTETAKKADVVLPAMGFAEKEGTFTNLERRVQRLRGGVPAPEGTRSDWQIIQALAQAMGQNWNYSTAQEIMTEIAKAIPIYGGIDYSRLEGEGIQWPCPSPEHTGTEHLSLSGSLQPIPEMPEGVEEEEPKYPFSLLLAPRLFDGGTMVQETSLLTPFFAQPSIGLHPEDASRLGIEAGEKVLVISSQGQVELAVRLEEVAEKSVLLYRNLRGSPANLLTQTTDGLNRVQVQKNGQA
ncbi:MAG: molybdopterin-dependent oxidoreductase, partial [Chloroflexi bacterium]|nr:molybdopterin-dependent oxidoreductase [Chloroflexota bacterium]